MMPATKVNKQDEFESFLDSKISTEVNILPPNDIKLKGRSKKIKKSKEKKMEVEVRVKGYESVENVNK